MWFPQRVKLIISAKYRIRLTTISETIFTETRAVQTLVSYFFIRTQSD